MSGKLAPITFVINHKNSIAQPTLVHMQVF
jgi:hypothetical protein